MHVRRWALGGVAAFAITLAAEPAQTQEHLVGAHQSTAVDFPNTLTFHLIAQFLGIEVQVRSLPPGVYSYALANEVNNLFDYGWIADYFDPQNFLDVLLHSTAIDNKVGGYNNAEFDRLLEQARSEINHDQRTALDQQTEQVLMDDACIIPLFHAPDYVLTKPHVKGFSIGPLGIALLQNVVIADRE